MSIFSQLLLKKNCEMKISCDPQTVIFDNFEIVEGLVLGGGLLITLVHCIKYIIMIKAYIPSITHVYYHLK